MASFSFNVNEVQSDKFVTKPGYYNAMITETILKDPNMKGTQQLQITWKTDDNSIIRTSYTVICPTNVEAEQIGKRFLKQVCESIGMIGFRDTNELCCKQHVILVKEDSRLMPDGTNKTFLKVVSAYAVDDARISGSVAPTAPNAFNTFDCVPVVFREVEAPTETTNLPPWQVR